MLIAVVFDQPVSALVEVVIDCQYVLLLGRLTPATVPCSFPCAYPICQVRGKVRYVSLPPFPSLPWFILRIFSGAGSRWVRAVTYLYLKYCTVFRTYRYALFP